MPVPDLYNNSTYQGDTITDKIQNRLAELNKATPFTFSNNVLNTVKNVSSPFAQPVNTTDNSSTLSVYYTGNTIQNKIQNRLNELKETTNPFAISQNVFKIAKEKVSDFFKPSPTKVRARDVLRESGGIISGGIKRGAEFITEQAIKTKESAPFIPEAARETFTKPELYGEFMVRNMAELDKSAVNVLNLVNKINPTYGIKPLQTAKQKIGDTLESIKKSFMLPEPTTATGRIIAGGAEITADFQKYAILDKGIRALFTPLATVFTKYKPETAAHLFDDAAMKAKMFGYDKIATQFSNAAKNIPKNPTEQIKLFTQISSQVNDLKFKGKLLGGMEEMSRRASGEMAKLALKEPALIESGMFELVKQLPEAARVFSNIGSLVALGQIDFEEGQGSRANQVLLDIAVGAAFEGAGVLVRRLSPQAKKIFEDIQQGVKTPLKNAEELAREIKSSQAGFAKLPNKLTKASRGQTYLSVDEYSAIQREAYARENQLRKASKLIKGLSNQNVKNAIPSKRVPMGLVAGTAGVLAAITALKNKDKEQDKDFRIDSINIPKNKEQDKEQVKGFKIASINIPKNKEPIISTPKNKEQDKNLKSRESIDDFIKTHKVIIDSDGQLKQWGNTLAIENNSPGNLIFAGQPNAVKGRGGFAKFINPKAGFRAVVKQVQADQGRNLTVAEFVKKYAPPNENDTKKYTDFIVSELGVKPDTKINTLNDIEIAKKMAWFESHTLIE